MPDSRTEDRLEKLYDALAEPGLSDAEIEKIERKIEILTKQ